MFSAAAEKITQSLCKSRIIPDEDKELYEYGFNMGLAMVFNLVSTVLIGAVFKMISASILFMLVYIPLRSYAGGYHAKTPRRCYFISIAIIAVVLGIIKNTAFYVSVNVIMLIVSTAVLFFLSPVEDHNKPLDDDEQRIFRKRSFVVLLSEIAVWLLLVFVFHKSERVIPFAVFTEAVMLIAGQIKNKYCKF